MAPPGKTWWRGRIRIKLAEAAPCLPSVPPESPTTHALDLSSRCSRGTRSACEQEVSRVLRYVTRKAAGWLLMIVVATNATYFLASWFLDPRSNYKELRPVRSEAQIDRALAPYDLDPRVPLAHRWWEWLTSVILRFDWGK